MFALFHMKVTHDNVYANENLEIFYGFLGYVFDLESLSEFRSWIYDIGESKRKVVWRKQTT